MRTSHDERCTTMLTSFSSAFPKDPGTNLEKIVRTVASAFQDLDDTSDDVTRSHHYLTAMGAALDALAHVYGVVRRPDATDEDVRRDVTVALAVRTSAGTLGDIGEPVIHPRVPCSVLLRERGGFTCSDTGRLDPDRPKTAAE